MADRKVVRGQMEYEQGWGSNSMLLKMLTQLQERTPSQDLLENPAWQIWVSIRTFSQDDLNRIKTCLKPRYDGVSSTSSLPTWPFSGTSGRVLYWNQSLPTLMKHVLIIPPSFPWLLAVFTDIDTYHESWVLGATKENHVRRLSALQKLS